MKKIIIVLLLCTAQCAAVFAQNASDFKTNGKGTITGYTSKAVAVIIPSQIDGITITTIGEKAFSEKQMISVTVPDSVTSIGRGAFQSCSGLTSVTFAIGSNITDDNFGDNAFPQGGNGQGSNNLKSAYATGKAGTYTREANGDKWTKK